MITKDKILLYLALILIIGLGFGYFNLRQENKELEKHIDETFVKEREINDSIFEIYRLDIETLNETNETLSLEIKELDRTKADINKKHNEEETNIRRISDADSIYNEVARHYRR